MKNFNNLTFLSLINEQHMPSNAQAATPSNASAPSSTSGRKFSFRNLFPDLRTETMIEAEKKRVAAALAKGHREHDAHAAASQRSDSLDSRRSWDGIFLIVNCTIVRVGSGVFGNGKENGDEWEIVFNERMLFSWLI